MQRLRPTLAILRGMDGNVVSAVKKFNMIKNKQNRNDKNVPIKYELNKSQRSRLRKFLQKVLTRSSEC